MYGRNSVKPEVLSSVCTVYKVWPKKSIINYNQNVLNRAFYYTGYNNELLYHTGYNQRVLDRVYTLQNITTTVHDRLLYYTGYKLKKGVQDVTKTETVLTVLFFLTTFFTSTKKALIRLVYGTR